MAGIEEQDKTVNGYADPGKRRPKNLDTIGPPISYMKERRVFQPLPSMTNPLGLCWFYAADPSTLSMLAPPKPPAMEVHLNNLLVLAKALHQPYIIVMFEGGPITPLGLLQELHMHHALVHIPIFWPDKTNVGHKPRVSCCPFCAYTIQNDPAYLNHIVNTHYHVNFACGRCLSAVTMSGQQMKRHISDCSGLTAITEKSSQGSARGERSPKKEAQLGEATSQEDSQTSDRHLTRMASVSQESTTGSSKHHSGGKKKAKKTQEEQVQQVILHTLFWACHNLLSFDPLLLLFSF